MLVLNKAWYIFLIFLASALSVAGQGQINVLDLTKADGLYYYPNSNRLYTGSVVKYFDGSDYAIQYTGQLKEGKKEGSWIEYYANGNRKRIMTFKDDIEYGMRTGWTEAGEQWWLGIFNYDKLNFEKKADLASADIPLETIDPVANQSQTEPMPRVKGPPSQAQGAFIASQMDYKPEPSSRP